MIFTEFNNMNFSLPTENGYFMYSKSGCKFCRMAFCDDSAHHIKNNHIKNNKHKNWRGEYKTI